MIIWCQSFPLDPSFLMAGAMYLLTIKGKVILTLKKKKKKH